MMRIVVDEMPTNPDACPYSQYNDVRSYEWFSCSKKSIVCEIGKDGWDCPFFTDMKG